MRAYLNASVCEFAPSCVRAHARVCDSVCVCVCVRARARSRMCVSDTSAQLLVAVTLEG